MSAGAWITFFACGSFVFAQNGPAPSTRSEEIERERTRKEATVAPQRPPKPERKIEKYVEKPLNTIFGNTNGFGVRFGGLPQGAGFSLGGRYLRRDLANENLTVEASLTGSIYQFWAGVLRASMPNLARRRLALDFTANHNDSPALLYFGPGPHSTASGETNYRMEATDFTARIGWKPDREHFFIAGTGASHLINVGLGISEQEPSMETIYSRLQAPGIERQTNYVTAGVSGLIDYRDLANDPHKGTALAFSYLWYRDYKLENYSFRRLDAQVEHYLPFLNRKRVIALRARTQLSYQEGGQQVPFYLQPTLGGSDDLRGFEQYRFHDNNSLLLSGEYRWEVSSALDVALFSDAGTVFARPGLLGFHEMQEDGGIGFRVKTRESVVLRLDAALSHEGFRLWLRFGNAFNLLPSLRR